MKKRRLIVCSLGLLTAAMLNSGMKYDGTWQVKAEEDTEEVIIEGEDWGDPDSAGTPDYSILSQPYDGDLSGENAEEILELEVELGEETLIVPREKMLRIGKGESGFPEAFEDRYFLLYDAKKTESISLYFNQKMDVSDITIYEIDVEKQQAKTTVAEEQLRVLSEDLITVAMEEKKHYLILFDRAEKHPELSVSIFGTEKTAETEATVIEVPATEVSETEAAETETPAAETSEAEKTETEMETASEPASESASEPETSVTETANEEETEPVTQSETETVTEMVTEPVTETEAETETETETQTQSETETEAETETQTQSETETEAETETETQTQSETETDTETETEETVTVESAELVLDEGLDQVPAAMLSCLGNQTTARVVLYYSDGSQQIPEEDTDSYGNRCQLTFEDTVNEDGSVSRTYTWKVVPADSTDGAELEQSETILFGQQTEEEIDDIKAQERTKVSFSGKKRWILVQTVPEVTGKYALKSFGREVEELYYLADGAQTAEKAEEVFELQEGVRYTFLLILE